MKIEISGNRCITCQKFSQYYHKHFTRGFEPIDCGYCGRHSLNVRPGGRCKDYRERSNCSDYAAEGLAEYTGRD